MRGVELHHGDCLDVLRTLPDNSVHAVVTDPPYNLSFMAKQWDTHASARAFQDWCELWATECLRVLRPGGYMLSFGGTRTWHRLAAAVEDAGFEIRDSIAWLYGSGFPKSRNLDGEWAGWGTALKPAFEPIVVARKPLQGTVAANVQAWGTGAINVDGCRVGTDVITAHGGGTNGDHRVYNGDQARGKGIPPIAAGSNAHVGRWPANVTLDGDMADALDASTADLKGGVTVRRNLAGQEQNAHGIYGSRTRDASEDVSYGDSGGASRFFPTFKYQAKAPTRERPKVDGVAHATVKPLELMRWLVRLVTPPGGVVLEPFAGSGTTVEACILEGFDCIAIEREADYLRLIQQRIDRHDGTLDLGVTA